MIEKKQRIIPFIIVITGFFTFGISDLVWIYIMSDKIDRNKFLPMKQLALTLITMGLYGIFWTNKIAEEVFPDNESKRKRTVVCTVMSVILRNISTSVIYNEMIRNQAEITGET